MLKQIKVLAEHASNHPRRRLLATNHSREAISMPTPSRRNRGALKFGLGLLIFIILAIIIYGSISFWSFRQG